MAIFSGVVRSRVLDMDTGINIILPYDRPAENQQKPCKILYLLHGLSNNHTSWCRNTNIEKYVEEYGIAVVMPEVQRSFYFDMEYGLDYFKYISSELPEIVGDYFNVSVKPEDSFIAGVSMGGYGALKCALTYPENYAGCSSFSGALDIEYILNFAKETKKLREITGIIGSGLELRPKDNLYQLAQKIGEKIPIYLCCGTEDYLYEINKDFSSYLDSLKIDHTFQEWSGAHEWAFWDVAIRKALKFFNNI